MVLLKSLAFLKAAAYVVAALVAYFKPELMVTDAMVLAVVIAVLNLFGVYPELVARGLAHLLPAWYPFKVEVRVLAPTLPSKKK